MLQDIKLRYPFPVLVCLNNFLEECALGPEMFLLPYDDIHDQEVSHQADDTDNHVDDHDCDFHPCWQ